MPRSLRIAIVGTVLILIAAVWPMPRIPSFAPVSASPNVIANASYWVNSPPPIPPFQTRRSLDCTPLGWGIDNCVRDLAIRSGNVLGAAAYCGATEDRMRPVAERVVAVAVSVARDQSESAAAGELMMKSAKARVDQLRRGEDLRKCDEVVRSVEAFELSLGMR